MHKISTHPSYKFSLELLAKNSLRHAKLVETNVLALIEKKVFATESFHLRQDEIKVRSEIFLTLGDVAIATSAAIALYCVRAIPVLLPGSVIRAVYPSLSRARQFISHPVFIESLDLIHQLIQGKMISNNRAKELLAISSTCYNDTNHFTAEDWTNRAVTMTLRAVCDPSRKHVYQAAKAGQHVLQAFMAAAYKSTLTKPENIWLSGSAHETSDIAKKIENDLQVTDICAIFQPIFFTNG